MGTKLDGGGCYEAALPDEPMFTLLARDPYAPELTRLWARNRSEAIAAGNRPKEDEEQVRLARLEANKMTKWRKENLNKWKGYSTLSGVQSSERRATLNFIGRRINDLALKGASPETVDALIRLSGEIVAGFHFDRAIHPADTLGETSIDLPQQKESEFNGANQLSERRAVGAPLTPELRNDLAIYGICIERDGVRISPADFYKPAPAQHLGYRQQDEYFCPRCKKRWPVSEDAPEECS